MDLEINPQATEVLQVQDVPIIEDQVKVIAASNPATTNPTCSNSETAVVPRVYILSQPHLCNCGSSDCVPVVNQNKLRQVMALKQLLELGIDLATLQSRNILKDAAATSKTESNQNGHVTQKGVEDANATNRKKYPCIKCGKKFRSEGAIQKHIKKRHTRKTQNACKECKKTFTTCNMLKKHIEQEHSNLPVSPLKKHHKEENSSLPVSCPQEFQTAEARDSQVKHIPHPSRHECNICDKSFSYLHHYKLHMIQHNNKRPHACGKCGKTFKLAGNVTNHEKTCGKNASVFQCKVCNRQFKYKLQFTEHERTHTKEKPFLCEFCEKQFRTKYQLKLHDRTHTGESPYECDRCGVRFKRASALAVHKRQHNSIYPHICEHCQKGFPFKSHLVEHVRTHTGEKPYPCTHCSKTFALKRTLVMHTRTHTGTKPWVCETCGKRFIASGGLKEHARIHTGEKPYKCPHCLKSFVQQQQLRAHKNTHRTIVEDIGDEAVGETVPETDLPLNQQGAVVDSLILTSADDSSLGVLTENQPAIQQTIPLQIEHTTLDEETGNIALTTNHIQIIQTEHQMEGDLTDAANQMVQDATEVAVCSIESLNTGIEGIHTGTGDYLPTIGENIQVILQCNDNSNG